MLLEGNFFVMCLAINIHGAWDALCEGLQLLEIGPLLVPAMPG